MHRLAVVCPALLVGLAPLLPLPLPVGEARAAAAPDAAEILDCMQRTRPLTNTVRSIELVQRDRLGSERVTRARIYGGLSREALRTLLSELAGSGARVNRVHRMA